MTGTQPTAVAPAAASDAGMPRRFGAALIALGVALAANSLLGPLVVDSIDYPVSTSMRNQTIGLDAATLAVIVPACIIIGLLGLSGNRAATLVALGPTTFSTYMLVQYIAGPDHLDYPPVLVLQLAIFAASWLLTLWAWHLTAASRPAIPEAGHRVAVTVAMAVFVGVRYLPGLVGTATNEALPPEVATDPAMYWLIVLMDLGIFVPVAVVTAYGLATAACWGPPLFVGVVSWFALVTIAVAAMALTMTINDDPNASTPQLVLFLVATGVVVPYALRLVRSLGRT